jgi:cytochrome c oxidase subunit IV
MRTVLQRFLSFNAENVASDIYWALGVVYLILLASAIASLFQSEHRAKLAWLVALVFLPLVGLYFYAFMALLRADYSFLTRFGIKAFAKSAIRPN